MSLTRPHIAPKRPAQVHGYATAELQRLFQELATCNAPLCLESLGTRQCWRGLGIEGPELRITHRPVAAMQIAAARHSIVRHGDFAQCKSLLPLPGILGAICALGATIDGAGICVTRMNARFRCIGGPLRVAMNSVAWSATRTVVGRLVAARSKRRAGGKGRRAEPTGVDVGS